MRVSIPVSIGELIDKISILKIKQEKSQSESQSNNINTELDLLEKSVPTEIEYSEMLKRLFEVNSLIWVIEDKIRKLERDQSFGEEFIEMARMIYKLNDLRAVIKRDINDKTGSLIVEEKIY